MLHFSNLRKVNKVKVSQSTNQCFQIQGHTWPSVWTSINTFCNILLNHTGSIYTNALHSTIQYSTVLLVSLQNTTPTTEAHVQTIMHTLHKRHFPVSGNQLGTQLPTVIARVNSERGDLEISQEKVGLLLRQQRVKTNQRTSHQKMVS